MIHMFVRVVEKWRNDHLAPLLDFITGSPQPPASGFQFYLEMGCPITVRPGVPSPGLPVSYTCLNWLDLPGYPSDELHKARLSFAIAEAKLLLTQEIRMKSLLFYIWKNALRSKTAGS
jgi:hypothetical protein